jgi:hypothetical protein
MMLSLVLPKFYVGDSKYHGFQWSIVGLDLSSTRSAPEQIMFCPSPSHLQEYHHRSQQVCRILRDKLAYTAKCAFHSDRYQIILHKTSQPTSQSRNHVSPAAEVVSRFETSWILHTMLHHVLGASSTMNTCLE